MDIKGKIYQVPVPENSKEPFNPVKGLESKALDIKEQIVNKEKQQQEVVDKFVGKKTQDMAEQISELKKKNNQDWKVTLAEQGADIKTLETQEQKQEMVNRILHDYEEKSYEDTLTRIFNRNALMTKGLEFFENAEKEKQPITVLSFDLDNFGIYNQALGHTFGDVVLQSTAATLLDKFGDKVNVRLGGEEIFISVGQGLTEEQENKIVAEFLEDINSNLNKIFEEQDEKVAEPGFTKKKLERAVLIKRTDDFNKQFEKNPDVMQEVRNEFADLGIQAEATASPAELMNLMLNFLDSSEGKDPETFDRLQKLKQKFNVAVGSATAGILHVETSDFENEQIFSEDQKQIQARINNLLGADIPTGILVSYKEVYDWISQQISSDISEEQKQELSLLKEDIQKNRFGRVIDMVNAIAEETKETQRGTFSRESMNMNQVTQNLIERQQKDQDVEKLEITPEVYAEISADKIKLDQQIETRFQQFKKGFISDDTTLDLETLMTDMDEEVKQKSLAEIKKIQKNFYFDNLTGSYNRQFYNNYIRKEFESFKNEKGKGKQFYSIASLDFDNLKAVNESSGHKVGDLVLLKASEGFQHFTGDKRQGYESLLTKNGFNPEEISEMNMSFIRMTGGEEFVMSFPGLTSEQSTGFVAEMKQQVSDSVAEFLQKNPPHGKTYWEAAAGYIENKIGRTGKEKEFIGTFTFGIAEIADLDEKEKVDKDAIWILRQKADLAGEELKKIEGLSGRGEVITYKDYKKIGPKKYLDQIRSLEKSREKLKSA